MAKKQPIAECMREASRVFEEFITLHPDYKSRRPEDVDLFSLTGLLGYQSGRMVDDILDEISIDKQFSDDDGLIDQRIVGYLYILVDRYLRSTGGYNLKKDEM